MTTAITIAMLLLLLLPPTNGDSSADHDTVLVINKSSGSSKGRSMSRRHLHKCILMVRIWSLQMNSRISGVLIDRQEVAQYKKTLAPNRLALRQNVRSVVFQCARHAPFSTGLATCGSSSKAMGR